jgi:hypothetical protein
MEENTQKSNVFFVNLTTESVAPSINTRLHKKKDWVFFGKDNLFPQYLIELADNCAIHNALLETKHKFIQGQGFAFEGKTSQVRRAEAFVESLDKDFLRKTAVDCSYFDGFYWQMLETRGGDISKLKHIDFSYIRSGKMDEMGDVEEFYFSPDWEYATKKTNFKPEEEIYKPKPIAKWGSSDRNLIRERGQLLQGKFYKPGKLFYAEPSYIGALNYIEISSQIAELHKNNIDNGMVGSMHIHLFEDLSDATKRKKVEKAINDKFVGSENAGKVVVTWSTNPDVKTQIEAIPVNDSHDMYAHLSGKVNEEIVAAHRVPLSLAGVKVSTGLQSDESVNRVSMEYFQNTVIKPFQQLICSKLQEVLSFNGIEVECMIKPSQPIDILASEELITQVMTKNEIRTKILGLDEIEGGDSIETNQQTEE